MHTDHTHHDEHQPSHEMAPGAGSLIATAVAHYAHQPTWDRPGLVQARSEIIVLFTKTLGYQHVSDLGLDPTHNTPSNTRLHHQLPLGMCPRTAQSSHNGGLLAVGRACLPCPSSSYPGVTKPRTVGPASSPKRWSAGAPRHVPDQGITPPATTMLPP
jgi:hypothetical protein